MWIFSVKIVLTLNAYYFCLHLSLATIQIIELGCLSTPHICASSVVLVVPFNVNLEGMIPWQSILLTTKFLLSGEIRLQFCSQMIISPFIHSLLPYIFCLILDPSLFSINPKLQLLPINKIHWGSKILVFRTSWLITEAVSVKVSWPCVVH